MILNKLVFPIKIGATFVEGAIPTGKLTANNINKDMFYVISPVVGATAITATFQNSLQSERPEYMNMEPSSLKVSDLVRESESYYDLIKDWNVWQGFMPSKVLGYVAYNRAGEIGISFNFRQVIVPHMVGQIYRGDIISEDFIPTENGYYIVKTPLFIYDDIEFTFNDVLIKLDDEILIKKAIFTAENTSTVNYSVDPSVYDSDFEGFDISITESIVHQINENTTDIKILFSNQNGIYYDIVELEKRVKQNEDDIALIQQKDIDQDSELRSLDDEKASKDEVAVLEQEIITTNERIDEIQDDISLSVKIDNETITRNSNQELEVSELVLNDINSRVKETEFINYQNAVQDFLNGKLDKKPDGVVDLINAFNKIDARYLEIDNELFIVVLELPEVGVGNKIYLVPKTGVDNNNEYDEYIYIDDKWEVLGTITIDLSNYYNKGEVDGLLSAKANDNEVVKTSESQLDIIGTKRFNSLQINNDKRLSFMNGLTNNVLGRLYFSGGKLTIIDSVKNGEIAVMSDLDTKVDKVTGKGLSTNDYTNTDKQSVEKIPTIEQDIVDLENDKVDKNNAITAGTKTKIAYDSKGLVTSGADLEESDIPPLPASKITQDANNRFVTDNEKSTWNGKQNALTAGDGISIVSDVISADSVITVGEWNTTTRTLALSDANKLFVTLSPDNKTVTVPTNANVPFPIGTMITFLLAGPDKITFVGESGVTLTSIDSLAELATQYGMASLIKITTNTWQLVGALE